DFAQRAARHFAETIVRASPGGSIEDHAGMVREALAKWQFPTVFERARLDDDSLLELIRTHWEEAGGKSGRLLRVLRDDLHVACEQGRFAALARRVRQERALAA